VACRLDGGVTQSCFHPERDQFHGCDHLAFDHRLIGGQRRKRNGFIDAIDTVDRAAVDHQYTGSACEQIGAAGKGALDIDAVPGHGLRDTGGSHVLRDVALFEPHHDDFRNTGLVECLDLGGSDRGAFLQHQ
jgi:hypothetical protein